MTAPTEPLTFEEALAKAHELELSVHFQRDGHVEITTLSDDDLAYGLGLLRTLSKALGRPVVARDPAAELRAAAADAAALLKRIDHWEGSVILADEVWATSDGMPKLTRELYDQWIELQDERNRVRAALAATEGEP